MDEINAMLAGETFSRAFEFPAPPHFISSASLVYFTNPINSFHLRLQSVSLAD